MSDPHPPDPASVMAAFGETPEGVLATLNAYSGDNVWEDVILYFPGYDEEATDVVAGPDSSDVVIGGVHYRYAQSTAEWTVCSFPDCPYCDPPQPAETSSTDRRYAPEGPDESDLEQNGVECHDCGTTYDDQPVMECPENPAHAISAVHITKEPLGYDDDQDHWHPRLQAYAYPAQENWPEDES